VFTKFTKSAVVSDFTGVTEKLASNVKNRIVAVFASHAPRGELAMNVFLIDTCLDIAQDRINHIEDEVIQ
jgi:hypothetical protein